MNMGVTPPSNLIPPLNVIAPNTLPESSDTSAIISKPDALHLPSGHPQTYLVYLTDGLPPITTKMFEKLKNWQYVNLQDLSPRSARGREDEQNFLQQCDGKVLLLQSMDQIKRKSSDFSDVVSWIEVFATVVAVSGQANPSALPDLMAYMVKIIRASRTSSSLWQEYDRAYRRKAAAKGDFDWSRHDPDLWDRYILAPSQTSDLHSAQHRPVPYQRPISRPYPTPQGNNQWKKTVCYSHNFDRVCARTTKGAPCQFAHICFSCGQHDHRHFDCPKRRRM